MKILLTRAKNAILPGWAIPASLLGLMVLAFGLLIPDLGFAYDEWHFVYYAKRGIAGLIELFHYDGHPQAVWSYILSFQLLGSNPIAWHIYSLVLRWIAVTLFWLCLNVVWPTQKFQTFLVAAIFALYPFFTLQVLPISYFEVWLSFSFLFLSIFLTLLAIKQPQKFWLFTTFAIAAKLAHAMTSEYTWFTEMMRPAFIWFVLPIQLSRGDKIRRTLSAWAPYMVIFLAMVFWRGFFYQPTRKSFRVQPEAVRNPVSFLFGWIRNLIPDSILILFTSWYSLINPVYFDLGRRFNAVLFSLTLTTSALAAGFLAKLQQPALPEIRQADWAKQAAIIGMLSLVFGGLPFYVAGYTAYLIEQPINSRIALGAIPGAALLLVALVEKLIKSPQKKLLGAALLIGLLVSWHVRYENDFRQVWNLQRNFLRQLTWRVPGLKENTLLVGLKPFTPPMDDSPAIIAARGDFPIALAINIIYEKEQLRRDLSYWYLPSLQDLPGFPGEKDSRKDFTREHATTIFVHQSRDTLFFDYDPRHGSCLHILNPKNSTSRVFLPLDPTLADQSKLENIENVSSQDESFINTIFGTENGEPWCYFYQKADLAAQYQDWTTVTQLWDDAHRAQLSPSSGIEYIPFIEAFANLEQWEMTFELTRLSNRSSPGMPSALCPLWEGFRQELTPSAAQDAAFAQANKTLKCK